MTYTTKLEQVARGDLGPDETLLVGVRGMKKGGTAATAGFTVGGLLGGGAMVAAAAHGDASTRDGDAQSEAVGLGALPDQLALGLTTQRLLIFRRSALTGGAKNLVAQLPRAQIRRVEGLPSNNPMRADRLTLHLDGGGTLEFEIVRNDGVQVFIDAFAGA